MKQHASTAELVKTPATAYTGKLIVCTSFYDYQGHAAYTQSMVCLAMTLEKLGINWDFWPVMGDFHIERCMNEIYSRFLRDDTATDILNIDSDESFTPESVLRLLNHPDEVVGGAYKMKNEWQEWTAIWQKDDNGHPIGRLNAEGTGPDLIRAERLPWGFLRCKRSALEKYIAAFPELWYHGRSGHKEYIFCQQRTHDHTFFSQDFVFSERLKTAGVELWLDPNITIGHWGRIKYEGNLHEHLVALHQTQAEAARVSNALGFDHKEAAAFQQVAQMAREIEERKAA
jgi:hypothetical protein